MFKQCKFFQFLKLNWASAAINVRIKRDKKHWQEAAGVMHAMAVGKDQKSRSQYFMTDIWCTFLVMLIKCDCEA